MNVDVNVNVSIAPEHLEADDNPMTSLRHRVSLILAHVCS